MRDTEPEQEVLPYGTWQSPMSIADIFNQPSSPTYPFRHDGELYWLQALPDEGGRIALMHWLESKAVAECLTPAGFNIRSQVHEYGGCCFCLVQDSVVFNNFQDGRLYRQPLVSGGEPLAMTPQDDNCLGFADIKRVGDTGFLVAVIERTVAGAENGNALVIIDPEADGSPVYDIASGCDFYASPAATANGDALAWIEWDHPDMPWDQTRVCAGKLALIERAGERTLVCNTLQRLMDAPNCAANQAGYLADGSLLYACDSNDSNWSNLYQWQHPASRRLTNLEREFGEAHWVFGQKRWLQTGDTTLHAIATGHDGDSLYRIDLCGAEAPHAVLEDAHICHLNLTEGQLQCVVSPQGCAAYIVEVDPLSGESRVVGPQPDAVSFSPPSPFNCSTSDGEQTFGYFYPPYNPDYRAPAELKPPLVVMVHGGPTSRTNKSYQPLKQYFTSLGFAVLDINHRGSTGYGRSYRQRLQGYWGEVDVMDIADAIRHLVAQGEVDGQSVFIRGGSAGGYAVLRALTVYPGLFAGGACYYGIGNLITLSEITHKFESRYTDRLVGEPFEPERARLSGSRYRSRSPLFQMDRLESPVIFFQGLLDRVVPPEVTREVVELLKKREIEYAYTEYDNEGHGFRNNENRIDSLQRETRFFIDILTT